MPKHFERHPVDYWEEAKQFMNRQKAEEYDSYDDLYNMIMMYGESKQSSYEDVYEDTLFVEEPERETVNESSETSTIFSLLKDNSKRVVSKLQYDVEFKIKWNAYRISEVIPEFFEKYPRLSRARPLAEKITNRLL